MQVEPDWHFAICITCAGEKPAILAVKGFETSGTLALGNPNEQVWHCFDSAPCGGHELYFEPNSDVQSLSNLVNDRWC